MHFLTGSVSIETSLFITVESDRTGQSLLFLELAYAYLQLLYGAGPSLCNLVM